MKNKYKIVIPVSFIDKKCAELNEISKYEYLDRCSNSCCPFFYLDSCPLLHINKVRAHICVTTECDNLV